VSITYLNRPTPNRLQLLFISNLRVKESGYVTNMEQLTSRSQIKNRYYLDMRSNLRVVFVAFLLVSTYLFYL